MVNAVSSNSKAVLSAVSVCNAVFSGRSKMRGSGSTPTKPVPTPRGGRKSSRALQIIVECEAGWCFKTQFGNFKGKWVSAENMFVVPTKKGETLPKLADLPINDLFAVLDEGEPFSTRVFSPCGAKDIEPAMRCFRKSEKN